MNKTRFPKRITALLMALALVIGLLPNIILPAKAAEQVNLTTLDKIADYSSFDNWKDYYGKNSLLPDGTRGISTWKAGGVWTDKSVYVDSSAFPGSVTMDNASRNFLVALSALASNKEIVGQSSTPSDTMLVLDLSQSMDTSRSVDDMIEAANEAIDTLLKMNVNNRVGVVLYSGNNSNREDARKDSATVILPLDSYTTTTTTIQWEDGQRVTKYQYLSVSGSSDTTVSAANGTRNSKNQKPSGSKNTVGGTYIQNGLFMAWEEFEDMADKGVVQSGTQAGIQRTPILVLMSDGAPTIATTDYYNVGTSNTGDGMDTTDRITFLTQLTAAWVKGKIGALYNNSAAKFYTLGLGTANNANATAVLNPIGSNNTLVSYWNNYNRGTNDNETVTITGQGNNAWRLTYQAAAEAVGRNYVDMYESANSSADLIAAFKEIVAEIGLQSAYSATLVESNDADLDGYITVQDELGSMMEVKDVKGILIGNTLFSGAELASSMNEGLLGSSSNPLSYGHEFVATVKERLGITDTSTAQNLIRNAYQSNQLHHASASDYSNYIGWYGDADNNYLGFWQESYGYGMENAPADAKYINKSYGYLGGSAGTDGAADMMHIVVMVHTEITTGHQTVLFRIPASLIPMVEYKVTLDGDSLETANEITLTVEEKDPIRLVYEVGLPDDVNSINIHQKVEEYLAQDGSNHIHKDANGNYVFYANNWDNDHNEEAPIISELNNAERLELTKHVAESHFHPNTANERFYIQEDSVVYTKNGNDYTPVTSGIDPDGIYYFARTIVTIVGGTARAMTQYEQLQSATIQNEDNFQQNGAGQWEVKAGTIRQHLSNVVLPKKDENGRVVNPTDTLPNANQLWVNVDGNDPSDYNVYAFLGNNGKLTVAPATGIKVTKAVTELADGAAADEKFPITVTIDAAVSSPVITDVEGNLLTGYTSQVTAGKTAVTLHLADGESAVISGLPSGVTYTVTEGAHEKYTASYTGATRTVAGEIVEGTVTNTPIQLGSLYITKEVEHAVVGEAFPTDYEFEFHVTFKDKNGNPIVDTFQLENNYDPTVTSRATDANGVMIGWLRHGETVHILGIPDGATVEVVENVDLLADSNYTLSGYRSRNFSGDTHDNDGVVTITSGQNATVVVTNTYTPKTTSAQLDLNIQKTLVMDVLPTEAVAFDFVLELWKNGADGGSVVKSISWNTGEILPSVDNTKFYDVDVPESFEIDEAGTYIYRLYEDIPDERITGMTYDRRVYTVTFTVTDEDGRLVATVADQEGNPVTDTDGDGDLDFTAAFRNEAHAATVSIDIEKLVEDTSGNPETSKAGFAFTAQTAVVNGGVWSVKPESEGGRSFTVYSDGIGKARMQDVYHAADTYHYIISEKDQGKIGWSYSDVQYHVTVVVTDDGTGNLVADMTIEAVGGTAGEVAAVTGGTKGEIVFKNTYDPVDAEVAVDVLVKKELNNGKPGNREFTFAIFSNGEASHTSTEKALMIGKNDADGNVKFTATQYGIEQGLGKVKTEGGQEVTVLNFSQVGDYFFDVVELTGSMPGVTYDNIIYDLVVEVTDDDRNGALEINYYFEDSVADQVTFHNTYTATPVNAVIDGLKTIDVKSGWRELAVDEFTFGLFAVIDGVEATAPLQTTKNRANGIFAFDTITYYTEGTYEYIIREIVPAEGDKLPGITYTDAYAEVTVTVIDDGTGRLTAEVAGDGPVDAKFVNIYESSPVSVSLPGKKTLKDRDLVDGEFKFAIYSSEATFTERTLVTDQITNDEGGNITFDFGTLDMGYHYFVVKEVIPEVRATGVQYDASEYYITLQVVDSGNGQMSYLTTVKHSGDPYAINPDIAFNNIYQPEPGETVISGTKTYDGGKALEDDVFSVGLYDASGELQDTAGVKANGDFVFEALEYTAADIGQTYTFTVKEIIPDGATDNGNGTFTVGRNIYDGAVYTVEITITDTDKDGVLEIVKTVTINNDPADGLTFTNTFVPEPVTHIVEAKKTYEKGLSGGDFQFKLTSTDGKTDVNQTKENAANGDILFDPIFFTEAGEYKFKLTEKKDGILSFIRPSQAEYEITVTVVNENGVLRVSDVTNVNIKNTGETNLEFINTYVMDGEAEITLRGTKTLLGDRTRVSANEFTFALFDADGKLIEIVQNDANGNFAFATLKFDETDVQAGGQISYTIRELAGSNACITYDGSAYTVVVTVKDNGTGGVEASYTVNGIENGAISFVNYYADPDPAAYTPLAKKIYNKALNGGEFKFKLEGRIDGVPVSQEKTNAADGTITFDTLYFPEAGTYTFKVTEIEKFLGFIQYSAAEYELVIDVIDVNGILTLGSVTVNDDPDGTIEFTNTYVMDGEDEITLRGQKIVVGGRTAAEADEFTFGLYDAEGKLIEAVKNDAEGNFVFTTLKFDETDVPVNGQKQFTYTVKEIAGSDVRVTYDETVYTVVVTVEDNDQGGVSASYTVNGKADGKLVFTNVYTPKPGDLTVDFRVVKTIVNKGSEKLSPEGFQFLLKADGLADVIVKSDANGNAKFTLIFTEADVGKTYIYKLTEVNDGKSNVSYSTAEYIVTVTISLNESNQLVAAITQNGEAVTEVVAGFENVYDYTPTPENPDNPQTGDNTNLYLWIALLAISGGGIIGTVLHIGKKKEEEE